MQQTTKDEHTIFFSKLTTAFEEYGILAKGLKEIPGIEISPEKLPTNLVFFDLLVPNPQLISDELNKIGIKGGKPDKRWRFVTHSDISSEDIYFALNSLSGIMKKNYKSN